MSRTKLAIRVETHCGHHAEGRPLRFHLGGRTVEISEILDRWPAPDHRYFKVRGNDGATYILRYDVAEDFWEMTMFQAHSAP